MQCYFFVLVFSQWFCICYRLWWCNLSVVWHPRWSSKSKTLHSIRCDCIIYTVWMLMWLLFLKWHLKRINFFLIEWYFKGIWKSWKAWWLAQYSSLFIRLSFAFCFPEQSNWNTGSPCSEIWIIWEEQEQSIWLYSCLERKKRFKIVYQNMKYVNFHKPIPSRLLGLLYIFPYGIVTVISGPCHLV